MSRVAKAPVTVPNGVTVTQNGRQVEVKGSKGTLSFTLHALVELKQEDGILAIAPKAESKDAWMQAGTARAVLNNLVKGVSEGFERQVAADIRGYRPPEPYKGKGVRYSDEVVLRKEAKKK
ncbi:hypothetical protein LTR94_018850 [Friedmanniomyces endolithicus]|nr:hypothetical protein LTR94_018850 [Friedmanniomyces endolithicus]